MTAADVPFEVDPQLVADIESALAAVTADPHQVGISDLHTTLHAQAQARFYLDMGNADREDRLAEKLLIADIEDVFTPDDNDDIAGIATYTNRWSDDALVFAYPELYDAVEATYEVLDAQSLLDDVFGSPDSEASLNAFEQFTGEWDGDL